jgi:hypothetical protein
MDNADARDSGDPLRAVSLSYAETAQQRMQLLDC